MQHAKTAVRLKAHKIYLVKKQIHLTIELVGLERDFFLVSVTG